MFAAHNKNLSIARNLIEQGASVLQPIDAGLTVFHMAAANNDVHLLDLAIQQKQHDTVDMVTSEGWTPAQHAAFLCCIDSLSLLMEHGADLTASNAGGNCSFDHIVAADHVELLEILWNEAITYDKNRDTKKIGSSGLIHKAAGSIGTNCLEYILQRHPNGKNNIIMEHNNFTEKSLPLHYAVLAGNEESVRILLKIMKKQKQKSGSDSKSKKQDPQSAAFQKYREQQFGKLITSGVDAQESYGCTALHLATLRATEEDFPSRIVPLLLKNGADPKVQTLSGKSSLDLAELEDNKPLLQMLQNRTDTRLKFLNSKTADAAEADHTLEIAAENNANLSNSQRKEAIKNNNLHEKMQ